MSKINVLSFEIANLIAAGEVVERPSSVLKELIENSIDSGASRIVAEIKKGGVALIRVTDNGCGIEKEDLPIALKRHATSKIREREDLDTIMTLGFRGEALAAISSVSTMTIISKTESAESATMLIAEAGKVVDISEVGASNGTTVVVENLFGNVPARRKFLKKDATEALNVVALVEKVAISHPEISIQLLIDGEERFNTPGDGELYNAIYAVFGRDFAKKLIKADGTANGIRVHGYIGRSDNVKKNRNLQNFFINGRYVKSMTAMAAIEKAYTSYIAPECFPVCALFLEMNPNTVDVNVHPAKLEVKFADERIVFESVYYTVKSALEEHEYRPELELGSAKKTDYNPLGAFVPVGGGAKGEQIKISERSYPSYREAKPSEGNTERKYDTGSVKDKKFEIPRQHFSPEYNAPVSFASGAKAPASAYKTGLDASQQMTPKDSVELLKRYKSAEPEKNEAPRDVFAEQEARIPDHKIIGELFDCYILVEYDGTVLVIDKHAAHERIIFEDLKKAQKKDGRVAYQTLLLPITVLLSPDEIAAVTEYAEDISSVGFDFNINEKSVDILSIPNAVSTSDAEALFIGMADDLVQGRADPRLNDALRRERALYQVACKAAIKGGRVYNSSVVQWLVGKVLLLPDITVCPHGRPIAFRLTKNELDRQFERIK